MAFVPFDDELFPKNPPQLDARGVFAEDFLPLPWVFNPQYTYIDARYWVELLLDNGMTLHKPLPQENPAPDTLASVVVGSPGFTTNKEGANLKSTSRATDLIRRMASSTYRFVLCGWALRVGYPIPVPGLVKLSDGTPLVPVGRQWSKGNVLVANLTGGIPVYFNQWRLPYAVVESPRRATEPTPPNPALHIGPNAQLPQAFLPMKSQVDQRVVEQPKLQKGIRRE